MIAFALWVAIALPRWLFGYLAAVPKELGAALVAGVAAVVASTVTVMVGRHFERKRELDALFREKKMEVYDEFYRTIFRLFFGADQSAKPSDEELTAFLREFMRKLLLWSGPEPIATFLRWKEHLAKGTPDAKSLRLMEAFLLSLRLDLRHSNKGIPRDFLASLMLKESALFLAMARLNPDVTLAEVALAEKGLKRSPDA